MVWYKKLGGYALVGVGTNMLTGLLTTWNLLPIPQVFSVNLGGYALTLPTLLYATGSAALLMLAVKKWKME